MAIFFTHYPHSSIFTKLALTALPEEFFIFDIICDENKLKLLAKGILLDKFPIFFYNKYSNKTKDFIYLCTYKDGKIETWRSNRRGMINIEGGFVPLLIHPVVYFISESVIMEKYAE